MNNTLSDKTPIVLNWTPISLGATLPDPYFERLLNWSKSESERHIYVVVNRAGLTTQEHDYFKELKNQLKEQGANNIILIDFDSFKNNIKDSNIIINNNDIFIPLKRTVLGDEQNGLVLCSVFTYFREYYYSKGHVPIVPMPFLTDAVRLITLDNIYQINETGEAIYFNFDVLPNPDKKIGAVSIPKDILISDPNLLDNKNTVIETSVIAVNELSKKLIFQMIRTVNKTR